MALTKIQPAGIDSSNSTLTLGTSNTTAITIDGSQNVGIGTTTNILNNQFVNYKAGLNAVYMQIGNGSTGLASTNGLRIGVSSAGLGEIYLQSSTSSMVFDTSGNIGIGTASSGGKFEVTSTYSGNPAIKSQFNGSVTYSNPHILLSNQNQTNNDKALIATSFTTSGNNGYTPVLFGGIQTDNSNRYGAFVVYVSSSDNAVVASHERMRIDNSGNMIIGGTTKYGKFSSSNAADFVPNNNGSILNSAISAQGSYGGGISVIDSGTQGYTMWAQTNGADLYIRRATTTGTYTGGVYISNAAGSWSAASDERLKNIISPIKNATEKLSTLRCIIGEYKENVGDYHPFLIAQDVQAVFPEVVNEFDKENGYLGMSYTDMVPILVAAIQELTLENAAIKNRLASIESK
jgi:hypothetical protein